MILSTFCTHVKRKTGNTGRVEIIVETNFYISSKDTAKIFGKHPTICSVNPANNKWPNQVNAERNKIITPSQ